MTTASLRGACRRNPTHVLITLGLLAAACGDRGAGGEARAGAVPLDQVLEWTATFRLGETPQALSVTPMVAVDPRGGFLVAEQREAQIRRYAPGGELLWHAGRKGNGPGEFVGPVAAVRIPTGEVLAADRTGRLTLFDSAGRTVVRTVETGIRRGEELVVLDDSLVLIGGVRNEDHDGPRLHVWNMRRDMVAGSFFSPLPHARNRTVAYVAGWTKAPYAGIRWPSSSQRATRCTCTPPAGRASARCRCRRGTFVSGRRKGPERL